MKETEPSLSHETENPMQIDLILDNELLESIEDSAEALNLSPEDWLAQHLTDFFSKY